MLDTVPPPVSETLRVTAVLDVPVTVAVNCCAAPATTVGAVGLTETATDDPDVTVTVACPDVVASATLVAFTW
ncbi:MAG TPA: hypothetical protein VMT11_01795 [Myxococcaceae bacterium]|nr:hypothetical protein [Myxococcaceae bacterium]